MKNRNISIAQYLETLQKEYLVAEIRNKIYPKISDKKFWKKVMLGKKEKIEDICFRNNIKSIFDDVEIKKRVYSEVYNESGLPNFSYKDDAQRFGEGTFPGLEETDIKNYYSIDSDVKVGTSEEYELGKISMTNHDCSKIFVLFNDSTITPDWYEADLVTRIL